LTYTYYQINDALINVSHKAIAVMKSGRALSDDEAKPLLTKLVILMVKEAGTKEPKSLRRNKTIEQLQYKFDSMQQVKIYFSVFTYRDFMNLFPIRKEYDGDKTGCRDYYSTIKYLKQYNLDEKIGNNVDHLIFEYVNDDIEKFCFRDMECVSDLMEATTGQSLGAKWAEDMGIPMMTMHEGTNGQKFMVDGNGRSMTVIEKKKRLPKYLRVVK
jgi:hypothetical protein